MTLPLFELIKVAALAAFVGLILSMLVPWLYAAAAAVACLWLLLARIT